jgi:hypothetical protein
LPTSDQFPPAAIGGIVFAILAVVLIVVFTVAFILIRRKSSRPSVRETANAIISGRMERNFRSDSKEELVEMKAL